MQILNDKGAPYFNGIDVSRVYDGRWFVCDGGPAVLTLSAQLALVGAGTITGTLFGEFTADPEQLKGIARLTMPDGCLHTTMTQVTWTSPGQVIQLTAAPTGAFGLTFAFPVCGAMRFRWAPTSIAALVAGANKLTIHTQLSVEG
jgi:hypothetical protein